MKYLYILIVLIFTENGSAQTVALKAQYRACEEVSEQFSTMAQAVGEDVLSMINTTSPNSSERKVLINKINKLEEDVTDKWYIHSKKHINLNNETNIVDPLIYGFYWDMKLFALSLVFSIPWEFPGKTATTYRRMIEEKCKTPNIKQ